MTTAAARSKTQACVSVEPPHAIVDPIFLTPRDHRVEPEPAVVVQLWSQVDRAVQHRHAILAAEAVGLFLRRGKPGPSRFAAPEELFRAA